MTVRERDTTGDIHEDLIVLRDQIKSTDVLAGFVTVAGIVAAIILAFSFLAGFNVLPVLKAPAARWVALLVVAASASAGFALFVLRPLFWKPSYDCLARLAEERISGLENAYINAVQLARGRVEPRSMLRMAIDECFARVRRIDVLSAVDKGPFLKRAWAGGAVAAALLAYMVLAPRNFAAGASMLFNPARFVPSVGSAEIDYVRPGDTEVVRGQEIIVEAGTKRAVKAGTLGTVRVTAAGGQQTRKPLPGVSPSEFRVSLGAAQLPFHYLVEIGGTESAWYHVEVTERPAVKSIALRYDYPQYTGLAHSVIADADGNISAVRGTKVDLYVTSTRPLAAGYLDFGDGRADLLVSGDEYRREAEFTLTRDCRYRIFLADPAGNSGSSAAYAVKAVEDEPPQVTITLPGRDTSAASGSSVSFAVEATDDYALGEAKLVLLDADTQKETVLTKWPDVAVKAATLSYTLTLDPDRFHAGRTYYYYATARDTNDLSGPGEGHSARYKLTVVDAEAAKAELVGRLEDVMARLAKVLAGEQSARAKAAAVVAGSAEASPVLEKVRSAQGAIRDETASIAAGLAGPTGALDALRRALEGLVAGDMATALDSCDSLLRAFAAGSGFDAAPLVAVQDRIIEMLRRIIGLAALVLEDARSGKLSEGTEIPADISEQLRKLLEDVKKFIEDQKRIIQATNNLAARPVDDFTDADKERLKELAADEEDWSKFLREAYSDLSKLPEQDFANPSMLKDIVETYSEIEMAADALTKDAVVIAVTREETGLELAESLTTHLEKWLADTPDRLKWEMEEPLEQVDTPMVELPASLQDMVGDLMEREEDIFDDIEDVSSSWADSIDKGAGWDAMDGPISNMSAQGVTGNVLPNSSEIAGRSGEGRTGRASGEFVGDAAVGKGGRRTPTRVTSDPFIAGRIEDTSSEAGGATGGGKEAGAGEKGLVGPVPRQLSERIAALAGRQSQIVSSAQKLNIALRLAGYPDADMQAAVDAMQETHSALIAGRLGNAIRQRTLLVKNLETVASVVARNIIIKKDKSLVLPKGLQEEIMDGARGQAPRGYDLLLRGYYESLSVSK